MSARFVGGSTVFGEERRRGYEGPLANARSAHWLNAAKRGAREAREDIASGAGYRPCPYAGRSGASTGWMRGYREMRENGIDISERFARRKSQTIECVDSRDLVDYSRGALRDFSALASGKTERGYHKLSAEDRAWAQKLAAYIARRQEVLS